MLSDTTSRLAKKASQLRISAISLAENMRNGSFKSLYRGQGIEFSGVRDYLPGDNVRSIDWNVTARMGRTFIKQYEEDRELSVFLILDCSKSMETGSKGKSRMEQAIEAAVLLLLAVEQNAGAFGTVFFDGKIRFSCSPKAGKANTMMILSKLDSMDSMEEKEKEDGSVLANAIKGASKLLKKRSLVFILSDFRSAKWEKPFANLAQKNDVVAIRLTDLEDSDLGDIGSLNFIDLESKKKIRLPTNSKRFKSEWRAADFQRTNLWQEYCNKHGAHSILLSTEADAALVLSRFFKQMARQN